MKKAKKIVAAAIAALSMGAITITASASMNEWKDFEKSFVACEKNVFTDNNRKRNSFENDAAVTVDYGAYYLRPVEFSVWSSADEDYGERLTYYANVTENGKSRYMPYYNKNGSPGTYESFYMYIYSVYNMNVKGKWVS